MPPHVADWLADLRRGSLELNASLRAARAAQFGVLRYEAVLARREAASDTQNESLLKDPENLTRRK